MIQTDILILGAGIGGYETFRSLAKTFKRRGIKKTITIVDKNNYFTFVPMLHEAAAGSIEPNHCAVPLRELVYKTPHTFFRAEVHHIDPKKHEVETSEGAISYDYCVVAMGSGVNYFGIPGATEHTYHVRSLEGAMHLHHDLIQLLEAPATKELNIVVVGGGFTGVEVAGQFCDLANKELRTLYPHVRARVHVIETDTLLLKTLPNRVRKKVTARLKKMRAVIHTGARAKKVTADAVFLDDGKEIQSDITIWTTGFQNIADLFLPKEYTDRGRIPVTTHLTHQNDDTLYAVGDIMFLLDPESEIAYPQLAEAAHREGMYVARHLARRIKGKKTGHFTFRPKGTLMPIGDWYGVAIVGPIIFFGRFAWWLRRTVYLLFMPGIVRKIKIVIDWTLHGFGFRYLVDTYQKRNKA